MFPVHIIDDSSNLPEDDICFLVSDKIYLKKKTEIVESLIPIQNISFKDPIIPYAKLHIKKIPAVLVSKILTFFKIVTERVKSEAIVLLCYNPKNKKYKILVPNQEVSYASVKYTPVNTPPNYILISTIHSHNTFGAFHSGTDKNDEEGFDGLHITFGNVDNENFTISASVVVNDMRFLVNPLDYLNGIEEVSDNLTNLNWNLFVKNDKKLNIKYRINYDTPVFIENEWYAKVSKIIPRFNQRKRHEYAQDFLFDSFEDLYKKYLLENDETNTLNEQDLNDIVISTSSNNYTDISKFMNYNRVEEKPKYDPCFNCPFHKYNKQEEIIENVKKD